MANMANCTPTPEMRDEIAIDKFYKMSAEEKQTVWRRVRDAANKNSTIRCEMVEKAILGGLAPSILRGLGE